MPTVPTPMDVETLIKKLQLLKPSMRVKLTHGTEEYFLDAVNIESENCVSITMIRMDSLCSDTTINNTINDI